MRALCVMIIGLVGCGEVSLPAARLPTSTSTQEVPEAEATVTAAGGTLYVGEEPLVGLDTALTGDAIIIKPLYDRLVARAEGIRAMAAADPGAPAFRGALGMQIDAGYTAELLLRIVYTAGQAGFAKPWLVVADQQGQRHGIALTLPAKAAAGVAKAEAAGDVVSGGYANPTVDVLYDRGFLVHVSDAVVDPGAGLLIGCASTPCGEAWPVVELNRLARRVKLDHPRDRGVIVQPGPDVSIQVVVSTFDATRHDALAGRGARELFPDVLLGMAP